MPAGLTCERKTNQRKPGVEMAMMHAYGKCAHCGEEGALWRVTKTVRRFWLFGRKVTKTIHVCDECDSLFAEAGDCK